MRIRLGKTPLTLVAAMIVGAAIAWLVIGMGLGPLIPRATDPAPAPADRPRVGGTDITFLWASDTHVGAKGLKPAAAAGPGWIPIEGMLERMIDQMNAMPGRAYPVKVGGEVAAPLGLVISGDLTESGTVDQWNGFDRLFGLTGSDGRLTFPVYEGIGNHDRLAGEYVADQITRRHGATRYSWQWGDLHVVCLGEGPRDDDLAWLATDLAAAGADRPVIVYLHYSLVGPFSDSNWFGFGGYADKMAEVLRPSNVIAIFHGHFHGSGWYQWKGFDVYDIGSAKHGWKDFAVVRVTDTSLTVAAWNWEASRWWWLHRKPINGAGADEVEGVVWTQPIRGLRYPPLIPHPTETY